MSICYICLAGRAIRRAVLCTRKEGDGIVSYIVISIFSLLLSTFSLWSTLCIHSPWRKNYYIHGL